MSPRTPEKATLVYDARSILGEGPVWDWRKQKLFWVDIEGKRLHRHDPLDGSNRSWQFKDMIGAAVPKNDGSILLALETGLTSFDMETQQTTPHQVLCNTNPKMRYNDGKVGPDGNFWIGSMHKDFEPRSGQLYRVGKDFSTSVQIPKTTISNGMAWTADHKIFYYIDTDTYVVSAYDFEINSGRIANKRTAFTVPKSFGGPDGMSIDAHGMLWVAHWGGNCVRCWDPISGEVLETVMVDAPQVTSCCFGGKNLETLYITTARSGLDPLQLTEYPLSGGLFHYKPKVGGTPISYF